MDNEKINSYKAKKYTSEIHKIFPQCLTKIIIRKKKKKNGVKENTELKLAYG